MPGPNDSSWQECQPADLDSTGGHARLRQRRGTLPIAIHATNARALTNAPMSETLNVDNEPVSVSLSTPNDPNPTVWVNHAVTVDASASTGPSGVGGMNCAVNGARRRTIRRRPVRQWRRSKDRGLHRMEQRD